ncbi:MAG: hypothetical protein AYK23_02780 [Candidatus Proteinoplasmatales archaeon SG8-5]|nr:MAG: hypothetical protein AYK23_02780 [Candidatus Proteinoplasmatales archaeon SG8-5]
MDATNQALMRVYINGPSTAFKGSQIQFQVSYLNDGNETAYNVHLDVTYPTGISYINSTIPPDNSTDNTWTLGDIIPGGSGSFSIDVFVGNNTPGTIVTRVTGYYDNSAGVPYPPTECIKVTQILYRPVRNIDTGDFFNTIMEAIDDTNTTDGHTIVVDAGIYYEKVVIDKSITLIGAGIDKTIVDAQYLSRCIWAHDTTSIYIDGFTFINGGEFGPAYAIGGGMLIMSEYFEIKNCKISNCLALDGGGICIGDDLEADSTGIIEDCIILNNQAGRGGGILIGEYDFHIKALLKNCVIVNNTANLSNPFYTWGFGGGLGTLFFESVSVRNCIIRDNYIWNNSLKVADQVEVIQPTSFYLNYSNIQDGYNGTGNIDQDPMFVDPNTEDYHLRLSSPCIDAGDPNDTVPTGGGSRIDMGMYEFDQLVYDIPLELGWNLVSLPFEQYDESIDYVLQTIDGKWDIIQTYDSVSGVWMSHSTFKPDRLNDINVLNHSQGFWIHVTGMNVTLTIAGYEPSFTSIPLYTGWNLVSYPSRLNETVANALWGTGADKVMVCDTSEPYHIKEVGPTYVMGPGEGYWVHVLADTVWTVDW